MGAIAEIFKRYGNDYIETFKGKMPYAHIKAIRTIKRCRTIRSGINFYKCRSCKDQQYIYRACGSRNCPNCQQYKTEEWLQKRLEDRLAGQHFMVTFTVPKNLRPICRKEQAVAYNIMFQASSEAIHQLMADKKYVGCDLAGFFGVLHTWGRQLQYHPHIHYIIPAGGIDRKQKIWKPSRQDYLVNIKALSKLYRGKLVAKFKEKGIAIPKNIWDKDLVVDIKQLGHSPQGALKYLAPYVYKMAISDSRIVSCKNGKVTFLYRKKDSKRYKKITVDVFEFMRRFLQHVLPSGFMKVRYYGFMSPSCKVSTDEIRRMMKKALDLSIIIEVPKILPKPEHCCAKCGGKMIHTQTVLGFEMVHY